MLSFFPLAVLDEIWDVIESVSEGFLTYSTLKVKCGISKGLQEKVSIMGVWCGKVRHSGSLFGITRQPY